MLKPSHSTFHSSGRLEKPYINRQFNLQTLMTIYLTRTSTPQVNTSPKANAEDVKRGPVHQVQVEVVLQLWGIQHFERNLGDFPSWFSR